MTTEKIYLYNVETKQLRKYVGCKASARLELARGTKIVRGKTITIEKIGDYETFYLGEVMISGKNIAEMEIVVRGVEK